MTNEEIHRCTDLARYKFETIPKHVFDTYRKELAEMAAYLRNEADAFKETAPSIGTPEDLNAQPEVVEYNESMQELIDQGVLGLECADGEDVVFEVTLSQFKKLDPDMVHLQRSYDWSTQKLQDQQQASFYIMTPAGILTLRIIDDEDKSV